MKAIKVEPSGKVSRIEINSYDDLNKAVGGYIEHFMFGEDHSAYVNEEGKIIGLPENFLATQLCEEYQVGLHRDDVIVGNMVILGPVDEEGEDTDINEALAKKLLKAQK